MKNILKQAVGIDVAQDELVVELGRLLISTEQQLFASKTFSNNEKGFAEFITWVTKFTDPRCTVVYAMEATGVYHEKLAYFLSDKGCNVNIVLPNKISNYAKTLDIKTVTDQTAAKAICSFALGRKLDNWKKPHPAYKSIRQLTRERDQLIMERTMQKNQLHAEKTEAFPDPRSIRRVEERISLFNKQIKEVESDIDSILKKDDALKGKVNLLTSIPGVGTLTAVTIIGETNGFELIRNKSQLVSYAGLDVQEKISGTSVKGKPRISKRGNRHLRKAMYMPALAAIRHSEKFKSVYARLISKHGIGLKAAVAIQRKLLELTYILWKTETTYDKDYMHQQQKRTA